MGRPDFSLPPTPLVAQHLNHDVIDDLPIEGLLGYTMDYWIRTRDYRKKHY